MKRVAIMALSFMMMFMEVGCMSKETDNKNYGDRVMDYMREKYQKEFTICFYEDSDYLSDIKVIQCYTDGMDKENEHVDVYIEKKNGKEYYMDNYFDFYIRSEMENYIQDMITKEFSECKVYRENNAGAMAEGLTHESTLEDLYRLDENYWMTVKVYVKGDTDTTQQEYQEKMQRIEEQLLASNHRYTIYIFAVSEQVYESIERYEQREFWSFYIKNRIPDGEKYYYLYNSMIVDGEVR